MLLGIDQLDYEETLTDPNVFLRPWVTAMNDACEKEEAMNNSNTEVKALHAPTLLIWGANDTQSTLANQGRLHNAIAGSRKVIIDKAGHYPFLEHPKEFNRFVSDFFTRSTTWPRAWKPSSALDCARGEAGYDPTLKEQHYGDQGTRHHH